MYDKNVGTDVLDGPLQTQRLAVNIVSINGQSQGFPESEFTSFWGFPSGTPVPTTLFQLKVYV